jgi:hypothetical protein
VGEAAAQRSFEQPLKFVAAHLDRAEAGEVTGHELRVEEGEASIDQPRHEIDQRDLARVARAREHAFSEEGAAEMHAVKPAHERAVLPDLDRVAMAEREQLAIEAPYAAVDPGRAAA